MATSRCEFTAEGAKIAKAAGASTAAVGSELRIIVFLFAELAADPKQRAVAGYVLKSYVAGAISMLCVLRVLCGELPLPARR